MKVTHQQRAILAHQVSQHAAYFQKLADRQTYTDLIHDGDFGEAVHPGKQRGEGVGGTAGGTGEERV